MRKKRKIIQEKNVNILGIEVELKLSTDEKNSGETIINNLMKILDGKRPKKSHMDVNDLSADKISESIGSGYINGDKGYRISNSDFSAAFKKISEDILEIFIKTRSAELKAYIDERRLRESERLRQEREMASGRLSSNEDKSE